MILNGSGVRAICIFKPDCRSRKRRNPGSSDGVIGDPNNPVRRLPASVSGLSHFRPYRHTSTAACANVQF